jgi:hypothetical protein
MFAAATLGAFVALAACDEIAPGGTNDAAPSSAAATPASPKPQPIPAPQLPEGATLLGGTPLWTISTGGVQSGNGGNGTASLPASGILSVIPTKTPVAVGDTITIRVTLTAPADRPIRIYAMRHCNNGAGEEATAAEMKGTGSPVQVEVTHTFLKNYDCIRFSLTAIDKLPIDVELSNLQFIKMPKT